MKNGLNVLIVAGLIGAVAAAVQCGSGVAAEPVSKGPHAGKDRGRIVFSSKRSGAWRIWIMNADGSGMTQRTKDEGSEDHHDVDPVFSPDGKHILFTSTRGGTTGIWRMTVGGAERKRICDGDQAEWSPDGKMIALRRKGRILTRELAKGKEKTITPKDWLHCSGPAWSPDGERIALARKQDGRNGIFILPAGGGEPAKVYDKKGACEPHWSPDGKHLVYETETHICTIRPDGTKNRLITHFGGIQRYARYSPDGKSIVFCQGASPRGPWEIYAIPSGGGTPKRLTEGDSDMYPDWK